MGQCRGPWRGPDPPALLVVFLGRGAFGLGAGAVGAGLRAGDGGGDRGLCSPKGDRGNVHQGFRDRSEEHTSELQSLMRISYAVFCLKKKTKIKNREQTENK